MKHCERIELFDKIRTKYSVLLTSVLWKLTGEKELFAEAMQNALLGMWRNVEKLEGKKAGAYIYRIALTANSKAWRNRIGRDGQITKKSPEQNPTENGSFDEEILNLVRKEISRLPNKQAQAIVMRYIDQHDYVAIADSLSCTEDTARSHVSKAVASLRDKIARFNIMER
jgi:RNA polymerase sigma factor (sigma-70 family)